MRPGGCWKKTRRFWSGCEGDVRGLRGLELCARARLGPGPILANRLRAVKQAISASLAGVAKRVPGQSKGRAEAREKTGGTSARFLPDVFSRLLSPAPLSCLCAAFRAARPAKPVARERQAALSNQHAEATEIAARRSIADCFFAAFFSEESAFSPRFSLLRPPTFTIHKRSA